MSHPSRVPRTITPLGPRRSADIEVDFGAGPATVHPATAYVDLTGHGSIRVPIEGRVNWSELQKLRQCTTVEWSGAERGVIEAVAIRQITSLYWHEADGDIDLDGTSLTRVRLGGARLGSC
ncbi:MAG TPA: hypothetical protein VGR21_13725, partial [Cryptosporangiaceae bacterium]|nr:hypothetical protein [Cryptosporangiaceae bacterium]